MKKYLIAGLAAVLFSCGRGDAKLSNGMTIPGDAIFDLQIREGRTEYLLRETYGGANPEIVDLGDGQPYTTYDVTDFQTSLGDSMGHTEKKFDLTYTSNGKTYKIWEAPAGADASGVFSIRPVK